MTPLPSIPRGVYTNDGISTTKKTTHVIWCYMRVYYYYEKVGQCQGPLNSANVS